jgi:hypothetical protein
MARKTLKPDERIMRPKTISEAKQVILETFVFNDWDERDQKVYYSSVGVEGMEKPEDVRAIIADLEQCKMILFSN